MLPSISPPIDRVPDSAGRGQPFSRVLALIISVIYILYSLEVGIFLMCVPWLGFWDNNYLLYLYPSIRSIVTNSFFKGAVLGLGAANIIIGIHEIVHFKRFRDAPLPGIAGFFRK